MFERQATSPEIERLAGFQMAGKFMPILAPMGLVLGGLYSGFFNPTEAGAVGAAGALVIALARQSLNPRSFWAVLAAVLEHLSTGVDSKVADIGALPPYNTDQDGGRHVADLIDQISTADGLIFVTPEYNYSIPGVLKNAIDWASRPAYASVFKDKPCMVITVSAGVLSGVRAQAHLKYILNGMLALVHPGQEIVIPNGSKRLIDARFADPDILAFIALQLDVFCARCAKKD